MYSKMKINFFTIVLLLSVLVNSCVTQEQSGTKTGALKYNPSGFVLHPQFKVFHESDQYTKLYIKLYTNELRFSSANKERTKQSVIKVNYKITKTIRGKEILDSAETKITVKYNPDQTSMISFLKMNRFNFDEYFVEMNMIDIYSNRKSKTYIRIDNSKKNNSQNYISLVQKNMKPVFGEYFKRNDTLIIKCSERFTDKLYVSYHKNTFKPAEQPFSTVESSALNLNNDSAWTLDFDEYAIFHTKNRGIYLIKSDLNQIKGLMKVRYKNAYPLITRSDELIETLHYLLKENEYETLMSSDNKKLAVDNYWIKLTENSERAKELIKIWYNRVSYSNYYFTSYKEGWKTDRGSIYMVMGPPDDIQYFNDAEKWIYTNSKEEKKVEFIFVQQLNSISENDFTLIRKMEYEPIWSKAIRSWRSGIAYNF